MADEDQTPPDTRVVGDVETLKALSDPLRLAILRVLMFGRAYAGGPPRSVKEIAAELNEPATKLYRHVKQLESRGLIVVAETRVVSGIIEHRYRAAQTSLQLDPTLVSGPQTREQTGAAFAAAFDEFRDQYVPAVASGQVRTAGPDGELLRPSMAQLGARMSPARAAELRARLAAVADEFETDEDGGVEVRALIAFFSPLPHDPPLPHDGPLPHDQNGSTGG